MSTYLVELFNARYTYNRSGGLFHRPLMGDLVRNLRWAGAPVHLRRKGALLYVRLNKKRYRVDKVIWALHYGVYPEGDVIHVNGNRADNRIMNLRCDNTLADVL
jgi:hypothetical protein